MNKTLKVALTVFCTLAVSCAFAQCRPGSPCYQGGDRGYSSYGDQPQYQQQPQNLQYNRGQVYQEQAQRPMQTQGQVQGQRFMHGQEQHPQGEPSHYYNGLPVYMEGNAQPPAGAQMTPPQGQPTQYPASGAPVTPPAGK
jgi:hypothetical protein